MTVCCIWISAGTDSIYNKKALVKARLVTGVYVLQKDRSKFYGSREKPECVLCKDGDEDRNHFILKCRTLDNVISVFMTKLKDILLKLDMHDYITRELFVTAVNTGLDSSFYSYEVTRR